jgi:hypothetical protein
VSVTLLRGNALALPLAADSVDLVVTSPPFFGLRSYTDGGQHYSGQLGSEATPGEFLDALIAATREMRRVLKPSGSLWINLGDKYATADNPNNGSSASGLRAGRQETTHDRGRGTGNRRVARRAYDGVPHKSLMLIPERYRIRCVDELGLIARAVLVWCLSGGARVYARTPTGDRPIMLRDLARAYRPEDVQVWNGERWTQVLGWNRSPDDEGALEFELRSGERVGCTPGHRWPTGRGVIRADEIRVGDVIATTRLPEPAEPRTPAMLPDEDIGWLVGLYVAEGSRSETTVQIAGHVREDARHARLARIASALDATCTVYRTGENTVTANLHGSVLSGVLDRYVSRGTAKTKRLQLAAWQRSDAFLAAVVDGYLSGDGHYDAKNDRWRLGFTANDEWAADLRTLAARLGAGLRLRRHDHQGFGGTFPGWRGEWRWTPSTHRNAKAAGEVIAIRRSRARDFYDLGVADEPHLFALASGVLTHNSKPNGLPESVTDRVRRSHEDWVHLTKAPRYYAAVDEIREAQTTANARLNASDRSGIEAAVHRFGQSSGLRNGEHRQNPLGKLPGSVWTIPTQPLTVPAELGVDHFAAFPMEWPRRLILGWSPPGICTECGEGRRPVARQVDEAYAAERARVRARGAEQRTEREAALYPSGRTNVGGMSNISNGVVRPVYGITGYACACAPYTDHPGTGESSGAKHSHAIAAGRASASTGEGWGGAQNLAARPKVGPWREYHFDRWTPAPTRPAVVLDPFSGTGTVALVADALGRRGIGLDMSADYCRLARWRTTDSGQRAAAMQVEKPPPVPAGHEGDDLLSLLDGEATA